MAQKKKIPEIRFKEFTDSWSNQPLSYYLAVSEEKNSANQYDKYDIYSVSREYGVINQIEYQGKSFAGASLLNYRVVNPNEVVYTKSPLRAQPYGIIKTNKSDSGIVSALYGVFKPNEEVDPIFVQTYFELDSRLNEYLRPLVNKGAKNTLLISDEDSISGNVSFPKKEEQEKMVKLFTAIDKLIRKLEEKLEKLKNIKQSLLNQMFTDANRGGWIPKIRFAGFNEEWKMSTAVDIFKTFDERNHPELPVLSATQDRGMVIRESIGFKVQHNRQNEVGYKRVVPGQFVIHLRSFQGGFAHSSVEGITSPAYTVMSLKESDKQYDYYWKYVLTSRNFIKRLETVTYGIRDGRSISYEDFSTLNFLRPNKSEQERIACLLKELDSLFDEQEEKLVKIRNMKAALLNKMFTN